MALAGLSYSVCSPSKVRGRQVKSRNLFLGNYLRDVCSQENLGNLPAERSLATTSETADQPLLNSAGSFQPAVEDVFPSGATDCDQVDSSMPKETSVLSKD